MLKDRSINHASGEIAVGASIRPESTRPWEVVRGYVSLTKPRIIELLLIATVPPMFLAAHGLPSPTLILATVLGGAFSAASASAFNCYIDRDIDRVMVRTQKRPLVTGQVSPRGAFVFATMLGLISIVILVLWVNVLSAALSVTGLLIYVVLYTLILKRRTSQNIIWGGIAGCVPALIGWASVRNDVSVASAVLFLIIFAWTPAHYWPLSVKYETDYRNASVPMLSAVRSRLFVMRRAFLYATVTVGLSVVLIPAAGMGPLYTVAALGAGGWFLRRSYLALRGCIEPMSLFHASITYLGILFIAVGADSFTSW